MISKTILKSPIVQPLKRIGAQVLESFISATAKGLSNGWDKMPPFSLGWVAFCSIRLYHMDVVTCWRRERNALQTTTVEYVRSTRIVHECAVNRSLSFFRKRFVRIVPVQLVEENWDSRISCSDADFQRPSIFALYFELLGLILSGIRWLEDWGMPRPRWRWFTLIQPQENFFEPLSLGFSKSRWWTKVKFHRFGSHLMKKYIHFVTSLDCLPCGTANLFRGWW